MASRREVVILSAVRTPIGRFGGTLADVPAVALGGVVVREALARAGVAPESVDEVLIGNVVQAGEGQNPARQASIRGGVPSTVGATTINKVCGSGLKAVMLGAQAIIAGDADVIVAGGMENMDQAPYLLPKARQGFRLGNQTVVDSMVNDGLWCAFENQHMGASAEWTAREFKLTRQELDECALRSHQNACAALKENRFAAELVPVEIPQRKGPPLVFAADECPRADSSLEALARLTPVFQKDGVCTAGNSSAIADGAAAVVVAGADAAAQTGQAPLARLVGYAQAGVEPLRIFTAPIFAVRKLMQQTGRSLDDVDLFEFNEAFAAQAVADVKELGVPWDKVNVNGSGIALGHPIGATGTRILVTLIHALRNRGLKTGVASLCLGGGEAVAVMVDVL